MPVTIFRWHSKHCPHKSKGRSYDRCGCPIWADGRPLTQPKSLGTRDRTEALRLAREIELGGGMSPTLREIVRGPMTIADGKTAFFDNLAVRDLSKETKRKHETLWRQLTEFAKVQKLELVADLDTTIIDRFMKTWTDAARSRGKKMERLRQFFIFAISRKWITENPMNGMKGPKVKDKQTPPFTPTEMTKILAEAEKKIHEARSYAKSNALRARALILFLRFSGLRIIDAVGCQIDWVKDGRVRLIARKNDAHIDVELPSHVTRALAEIPATSDLYFFWSGNGQIETAVKDWQDKLAKIFTGANIQDGHAHRFRDTFAVAMLERGESLQAVADALGDTLAVVQRHYNPWSQVRQSRQDEAVRSGWQDDAVLKLLDEAKPLRVN